MIPPLIYLDRFRNDGTRTYSDHAGYSEAREVYRPESPATDFEIPAFRLPRNQLNVYSADPDPALRSRYASESGPLFCVHPQLLEDPVTDPYLERILSFRRVEGGVRGTPSSSTRTLYIQQVSPPHALKLHFPFRVSRYGRRMRDEVVEQAVTVSRELQGGLGALDPGFAYLREVLGITHRNLNHRTPRGENWGYLLREMTPFPVVSGERSLVPGFSLFGGDFFDPEKRILLFDLLGDKDPRIFLLEKILLPIVRHWVECFQRFGFLLEPHGQNVLLEVDAAGEIHRIVHRDLNLGIDNRRRRELGLPVGGTNTYNQMESGEFGSITYDKFMGWHFFDYLVAALMKERPSLAWADFREPCKEEFSRVFPEHERYLPRTVQYFSEERDQFGKPRFLDTGQTPGWRP